MDAGLVRNVGVVGRGHQPPRLAFLDADARTWDDTWRRPLAYPKRELLPLIDYARAGGAAAIVVDVETPLANLDEPERKALTEYLRRYGTGEGPFPPLIMAASLHPETPAATRVVARPQLIELPREGPVRWGAALFSVGPDRVVRNWRLWEVDCTATEPAVPSIQLLLMAALEGGNALGRLDKVLHELALQRCRGQELESTEITLGGVSINLVPQGLGERILYTLAWGREAEARIVVNGIDAPLLTQVSAGPLLEALRQARISESHEEPAEGWRQPASDPVRGRVVILGASAASAGDWQATPVGGMPGSYVLANAITTIAQYGNVGRPAAWWRLLIGIVVAMLVWAMFEFLQGSVAVLLSGALAAAASLLLSRFWLERGMWMDVFLPSAWVMFLQSMFDLRGLWTARGRRGWRALLKSTKRPSRTVSKISATVLLLLAPLTAAAQPVANPQQVAGRIVAMLGLPSEARIIRQNSDPVRVNYLVDLYAGDRVEVLGGKPMTLEIAGQDQRVVLEFGMQPFVVPSPTGSLPLVSRLTQDLYNWLGLQKRTLRPATVTAAVRDDAIRLRAFERGSSFVAAGPRAIPLMITGGKQPYRVVLRDAAGLEAAAATGAVGVRFTLPVANLLSGQYRIDVRDSEDRQTTANFDVLMAERVPQVPDEAMDGLTGDAAKTAEAIWLARQQNGAWALEAMVRAAQLDGFEPAGVLIEALLQGRRPGP